MFQVIAARYEVKSTIVTSNLTFSRWLPMFGNDQNMTSALISRLIDRSTVLNMDGENYRLCRTVSGSVEKGGGYDDRQTD